MGKIEEQSRLETKGKDEDRQERAYQIASQSTSPANRRGANTRRRNREGGGEGGYRELGVGCSQ